MRGKALDLKARILARATHHPGNIWTPTDFLDLGPRASVDKALQRLTQSGALRRIDRGLYDRSRINSLTGNETVPDHRAVVDAIARRDQSRILVDGLTAANDLGVTTAVPACITVLTDRRSRSVKLGNLDIRFTMAAPSRLYWAGRPAMRIVQALHWLKDMVVTDHEWILSHVVGLLSDPRQGPALREDLAAGLHTLPTWMHPLVREALAASNPLPSQVAPAGRSQP